MEYILGFVVGLSIFYFFMNKNIEANHFHNFAKIKYSQSHILSIIKDAKIYEPPKPKKKNTQSKEHYKKTNIKVIIIDDSAYWIKDNLFYTAKMIDGIVDKNTTSTVDIMSMDKVELEKMMFIIDKLREEEDYDSRSSGD